MTCHQCSRNFCWQCLVPYVGQVVHREGCPHGVRNVAAVQGNWMDENMTQAQINRLIAHGGRIGDGAPVLAAPAMPHPVQLPAHLAGFPMMGNHFTPVGFFQALFGNRNGGG